MYKNNNFFVGTYESTELVTPCTGCDAISRNDQKYGLSRPYKASGATAAYDAGVN